ncbi:MAG: DEAD/DEAH box helicase family protein, partial [Synergistaceae bacterium]|nr:DEAD/DEAH box helicase family protein [Synergistaceae bacterium]
MEVKLKFRQQDFQTRAAESVCEIFNGQPNMITSFTVENHSRQGEFDFSELFTMWGNHEIELSESQILANLQSVQKANDIDESNSLAGNIFTIEMETGTGKTYTYIKTIYELNKKYGWSKFIIVVPSIAIREGVCKTFQVTESHFMSEPEYKVRADYFIYDSSNLSKINAFASDSGLKVMIINSQAFNARGQDARRIRMELDEFRSRKPLDVIADVRPIVIIDEPQSVEGQKTKESLQEFNPLFTLRYSATPKEYYNLVYKLDAVDAYNQQLVKRIKVTGISLGNIYASGSYVYLRGIIKSAKDPVAQIEFDRRTPSGNLKRVTKILHEGDDLYKESGELDEYKNGFVIKTIDGLNGSVEFTQAGILNSGEVSGNLNEEDIRRLQIRETIQAHLEKERQLYPLGIKVLSLFFID